MKPILYYDDRSPPVRSCLLLIKMLDIDVEYKYIDLFKGAQLHEDFLKINPAHTVPTLVHDDLVLTDSHSILMYLCDTFGSDSDDSLFPQSYKDRLRVIDRLFFECSVVFRRDSDMLSEIVRKGFANIDLQYHQRKILEAYSIMEQFLKAGQEEGFSHNKFMAGHNLTIADISLLTTLSTVDMMFPIASDCNEKWPLLAEWFCRMKALPEYQINEEGLEKLRTVMEQYGNFKFPTSEDTKTMETAEKSE